MVQTHPAWLEHQRKRWLRPDWQKWLRPDWQSWLPPNSDLYPKPLPDARKDDSELYAEYVDLDAEREFLFRMRSELAAVKAEIRFRQLLRKAGFNPDEPRDDHGRWTDGDGSEGRPEVPAEAPATAQLRNLVVKEVLKWLAKAAMREAAGPIGTFLNLAEGASWLYEAYPYVRAYFDEPKTLDELQQAVSTPEKGYDVHHVVEKTSAGQDGYPPDEIDAPENLMRIPTLKHWEINGWYGRPNKEYGGSSPREYLRGKDWVERVRVGHDALIQYGVLKP